ncbi:MAG TPA: hypothetical protein VMM79_20020 [Longimicrobiales bacterium]|nr:hypothetical protein [Longimicrobiales bacterium]
MKTVIFNTAGRGRRGQPAAADSAGERPPASAVQWTASAEQNIEVTTRRGQAGTEQTDQSPPPAAASGYVSAAP